ncbi:MULTISPECIES: hypothetical protein [Brevundimonas]|jgi:hypothetical protein|uniref:DUF3618 domain-containing protein n=1 Tax=Brevundimonas vesicularis TaxID=41276 RepID=A0ABU4KQN6_BREVE|nr:MULTISPECIES: hypothetical protein [Brevundimonas]MDX2335269.1 hypothetical protein [Brevundimonas vesicularis]
MNQTPTSPETFPAAEKPAEATPAPLSDEEAHRLDVKTERDARRQAEVGQIVRGGGG